MPLYNSIDCLAGVSTGEKYSEDDCQIGGLDSENLAARAEEFQVRF